MFLPHLATTPSTINKQPTTPSFVEYNLQVNKTKSTSCVEDSNTGVGHLWHQRLGHPCNKTRSLLLDRLGIKSKLQNEFNFCNVCPLGKAKQFTFPTTINKTQAPFELVFSDVSGALHI